MRIGIDTHAAEQEVSGNTTYIRNLVSNLAEIDHKNEYVLFVTDPAHSYYRELRERPNFKLHQVRRSPAWFRVFISLAVASYQEKVDLLHVQYFAPPWHAGRLIVTIHDLIAFRYPGHFRLFERCLFRLLVPLSARKASAVLTVSDTSKQDLIHFLNLDRLKIKVTYDGVNFRHQANREGSSNDVATLYGIKGRFLLYAGRIDARKNLGRLVNAYCTLRKNHGVDHKLVIVGQSYFKSDSFERTLSRSEFRGDILMPGYIPDDDLQALYRTADVFVYISEDEGFGLPPLEAMSLGTPVVASNITVFREILGDAALLVNPYDEKEIAGAIHTLLSDDRLRQSLVEKGKQRASQFTWKKTATATLEAYKMALNNQITS